MDRSIEMRKIKVGSKKWRFIYGLTDIEEIKYNADIDFYKHKGFIEIVYIEDKRAFDYTPYGLIY